MNTPAMIEKDFSLESVNFVMDRDKLLIAIAEFLRMEKYNFYGKYMEVENE